MRMQMMQKRKEIVVNAYSPEPITLLIHSSSSRGRSLFEAVSPEIPPSPPAKEGEMQRPLVEMLRVRDNILLSC